MTIPTVPALFKARPPSEWPDLGNAPMSVSRLNQLEACPRRWALGAAHYPEIWKRRGYPRRLSRPAFRGLVLHRVIELIIQARDEHPDQRFIPLMRSLGGYPTLVSRAIEDILASYGHNPRVARDVPTLRAWAAAQASDWCTRSQQFVVSLGLAAPPPTTSHADSSSVAETRDYGHQSSGTLAGVRPEVDLSPPALNWFGRADLIRIDEDRCEIVDIKSGQHHDEHAFQVQVYALLWARDPVANPDGRVATHLTLAYPGRDVAVPVPSASELDELAHDIERRAEQARAAAAMSPPAARPSVEACSWCDVRHLCTEYWLQPTRLALTSSAAAEGRPVDSDFDDVQVAITERRGETSWYASVEVASRLEDGERVIVDCKANDQTARAVLDAGGSVRLLGVHIRSAGAGPGDEPIVLAVSQVTEVFEC